MLGRPTRQVTRASTASRAGPDRHDFFPNSVNRHRAVFLENLARALRKRCRVRVVAPVPYAPPLPQVPRWFAQRSIPRREILDGIEVLHPRFIVLPKLGVFTGLGLLPRPVSPVAAAIAQSPAIPPPRALCLPRRRWRCADRQDVGSTVRGNGPWQRYQHLCRARVTAAANPLGAAGRGGCHRRKRRSAGQGAATRAGGGWPACNAFPARGSTPLHSIRGPVPSAARRSEYPATRESFCM